ncbi:short chain dehydrogenase reductase [Xylogone sp. PMI_703]|nr:short chain dehydrogenase reductase [Xylogone sp. PMI_703]
MASLDICFEDIPKLRGKKVILTGGSSGIGLAAARIFAERGAQVLILDRNPPPSELIDAFAYAGDIDIAISNAGVSEEGDYFADTFDDAGNLLEPAYSVVEVNFRAVVSFTKLALSHFRKRKSQGSIVITSSSTAYWPEQSLPVYSATKLALVGLIRALRSTVVRDNITINAVAPAATITNLLPQDIAAPIIAAGLPVSTADFVGLAIVYSAVKSQSHQVELYGRDPEEPSHTPSRWNGRTILTLGDRYTELEEPIASLRRQWFGEENTRLTRLQQAATDFRSF